MEIALGVIAVHAMSALMASLLLLIVRKDYERTMRRRDGKGRRVL